MIYSLSNANILGQRSFLAACFLVLFTCFSTKTSAQLTSNEPENKSFFQKIDLELAVKGSFFLDRFYHDDNSLDGAVLVNPYILNAKLLYNNIGVRAGLGGRYKTERTSEVGFADNTTVTNRRTDWRLGLEYRIPVNDRWAILTGVDYIKHWNENKSVDDSGFDSITNLENTIGDGFGPSAGVLFSINKRIKLYTEVNLYYRKTTFTNGQYFRNFPVFDDTINEIRTKEFLLGMPSTVFLTVAF